MVTTPLKTIIDVVEEGKLSEDLLVQAIRDALNKGLTSRKELKAAAITNTNLPRILNEYQI